MTENPAQEKEFDLYLFSRLKWSLFFRLVIVTVILISIIGFHLRESRTLLVPNLIAVYIMVGFSYFFTLVSLIASYKIRRLLFFSYVQMTWEVIFATVFIYLTGVWDSLFGFLYILAIIISSLLLFRLGAFVSASACAVLFGAQIFGVKYGWIPPRFGVSPEEIDLLYLLRNFFYYIFYFFASASLASYLTEQLRRTKKELSEVKLGFDRLEVLNEAIVRSIKSGLMVIDSQGKIGFVNRSAEKILGKRAEELTGKALFELFPDRVKDKLEEARKKGGRKKINYTNFHNQDLVLECSWQRLENPGDLPLGELLVISDVSELEKMEERLRTADRLATVGKLAAGIAHEIRNPLGAISGSVELLKQETSADETFSRLMGIVLNETERLNKLITDFLLYAWPKARDIQAIHLDRLFKNLVEMLIVRANNVKLELKMEPDMIIYADPKLIEQIFWNLANNALEAMPEGGRLEIRGGKEPREVKQGVWFSFSDTGIGISEENLRKIFEPFFTTKDKGTGLGLSMVWRIVEEIGGEIEVQSREGKGADFRIWLPSKSGLNQMEN